mgnify:CR=1 FL=1
MDQREAKNLVKMLPPDFREHYFSLFKEPEPETLYPELYRKLIDDGTDVIIRHLSEYSRRRRELIRKVKEKIKIKSLSVDEEIAKTRIVASDAGNNGVDLRSAFLPLYASAAIVAEGWKIPEDPIFKAGEADIWFDGFKLDDREALLASKIQAEVTLEAIERWKPKAVVFDGTLLLHFWLLPRGGVSKDYQLDFDQTLNVMISLLQTCYERDIPIVGFAKRTRMNQICRRKFKIERMRDTALLDLVLRLGEYTLPESEPMKGNVVEEYKKKAEEMKIPKNKSEKFTNIYFSYIKTGLTTPFRLEIPEYCLDRLDEVGTILYSTSEEDGIPFAINEADRLTRITTSISNIRSLMLYSKALDLVKSGEMKPEDLSLLIPQHGEPWVLRDHEIITGGSKEK